MRKLIIFLCLTLTSLSSYGEWKKILQNEYIGVYVDSEKIVKNKTQSKIWSLMDFTNPEKNVAGNGYSSTVTLWLYDCKGSTHRFLSATQYDKNMGGGKVINQVPEAKDWEYVVPNTVGETIGKIACK
jgi:hypothetical protein